MFSIAKNKNENKTESNTKIIVYYILVFIDLTTINKIVRIYLYN